MKSFYPVFIGVFVLLLIALRLFQPGSEHLLTSNDFRPDRGFAYHVAGKAPWPLKRMVLENGRPLQEVRTIDDVRTAGQGRYFWIQDAGLYLAPLDNNDPRNGDSVFTVRTFIFVRLRYIAIIVFMLLLSLTSRLWSRQLLRIINKILPPSIENQKQCVTADSVESPDLLREDYGMNWDEFDLSIRIQELWSGIDKRYKTAIIIALPITLLTFSIFTFHYLLTDHYPNLPTIVATRVNADLWFSRFPFWLTDYKNIPVLQQTLGVVFLLGAGIGALRLWGLRSLTSTYTTIILLVTAVHPNNIVYFYYTGQTVHFTFSMLLAPLGMVFASRKVNDIGGYWYIRSLIGGILFCFAVATYPPVMSVTAMLAVGYAIMCLEEHCGGMKDLLLRQFRPVWSIAIAGISGGFFYWSSLKYLGVTDLYNTSGGNVLSFAELPKRFFVVALASFHALWITQPEFSRSLKVLLLIALLSAAFFLAISIVRRNSRQKKVIVMKCSVLIILLISLVLSTKLPFYLVTLNNFYEYRYNMAMPFLTMFCFYAIFATASKRYFGPWRSIAVIAACCVIFVFARSDLLRQGMLLTGYRNDMAIANRILERIEALPGLDYSKRYYFVRVGAYSAERRRILSTLQPYDTIGGGHMDLAEIGSSGWAAEAPLQVMGSRIQFKSILDNQNGNLQRARNLIEKHKAKRWPDSSSVFVDEDMIVVNM